MVPCASAYAQCLLNRVTPACTYARVTLTPLTPVCNSHGTHLDPLPRADDAFFLGSPRTEENGPSRTPACK